MIYEITNKEDDLFLYLDVNDIKNNKNIGKGTMFSININLLDININLNNNEYKLFFDALNQTNEKNKIDDTAFKIFKNEKEVGEIASLFKETGKKTKKILGYKYFNISFQEDMFTIYEIYFEKNRHFFLIYNSFDKIIGIIAKDNLKNKSYLYFDEYKYSEILILFSIYQIVLQKYLLVENLFMKKANLFLPNNKELLDKYNPEYIKLFKDLI